MSTLHCAAPSTAQARGPWLLSGQHCCIQKHEPLKENPSVSPELPEGQVRCFEFHSNYFRPITCKIQQTRIFGRSGDAQGRHILAKWPQVLSHLHCQLPCFSDSGWVTA